MLQNTTLENFEWLSLLNFFLLELTLFYKTYISFEKLLKYLFSLAVAILNFFSENLKIEEIFLLIHYIQYGKESLDLFPDLF